MHNLKSSESLKPDFKYVQDSKAVSGKPEFKRPFLVIFILSLVHIVLVSAGVTRVGIQGGFPGFFTVGCAAWFLGLVPGLIMAALAYFYNCMIFIAFGLSYSVLPLVLGLVSYVGSALIVGYISSLHRHLKETKNKLAREYEKTERLMDNILPRAISDRLKKGETLIADKYEHTSILFCDIVGFTSFAREHSPEQLVTLLNKLTSGFDSLSASFSLEKIKTMGDCYLVAAGVPEASNDHAVVIADMALEMIKSINLFNEENDQYFNVRIGIHSGPVVGGVIGSKKFTFDIWGDAVNVAARMESQGLPGEIQVSGDTYDLLKNDFIFEERGSIDIKNRGLINTWLLKGRIV